VYKSILWIYDETPIQRAINARLYFNIKGLLNLIRISNKTRIDIAKIEKNIFSKRKLIDYNIIIYIKDIYAIKLV
jgi:hypothetical protein